MRPKGRAAKAIPALCDAMGGRADEDVVLRHDDARLGPAPRGGPRARGVGHDARHRLGDQGHQGAALDAHAEGVALGPDAGGVGAVEVALPWQLEEVGREARLRRHKAKSIAAAMGRPPRHTSPSSGGRRAMAAGRRRT